MTFDLSQFSQAFFEEAEEHLQEMERLLLKIDLAHPDEEDLNAIFRAAHSIKGGAGTFGMFDMMSVTHVLESLLENIRSGLVAITTLHVDIFLRTKDVLLRQLAAHRDGERLEKNIADSIMDQLTTLSIEEKTETKSAVSAFRNHEKPADETVFLQTFNIKLPISQADALPALLESLRSIGVARQEVTNDVDVALSLTTGGGIADVIDAINFFVDDITCVAITTSPVCMLYKEQEKIISEQKRREDKRGYGFFNQLGRDAQANKKIEDEQGYGFFDQHDATTPDPAPQEDLGYGFFDNFEMPVATEAQNTMEELVIPSAAGEAEEAKEIKNQNVKFTPEKPPSEQKNTTKALNVETSSIRVPVEKVDRLINLVGELMITHSMLEKRSEALNPSEHEPMLRSIKHLLRNTKDMQEAVMSIRMTPIDFVFSRFPRMVRDLANKLGKKVELVSIGSANELDRCLIERIIDPLTHLVRNSVDHGIESPEKRIADGKAAIGNITLSAVHQGGTILIEVTDDGAGMSREKIMAKARERDMDVSDDMSDNDVFQMIFAPGFSTAEKVTEVSGRGVGMDVVKKNITSMGGSVTLRSELGVGSTISISLPLTLAIMDGITIACGESHFVLPMGYVIESLRASVNDIREVNGEGKVLLLRGDVLPIIELHTVFGLKPKTLQPHEGIIVILKIEERRAALWIDALVGQQQVVVKNIESNYKKTFGISGATIMGDGGVSLIIDVASLLGCEH
jgi:two-component system chemotaxis sensor kinase CheA